MALVALRFLIWIFPNRLKDQLSNDAIELSIQVVSSLGLPDSFKENGSVEEPCL